jgi:ERCC4-type nuclease
VVIARGGSLPITEEAYLRGVLDGWIADKRSEDAVLEVFEELEIPISVVTLPQGDLKYKDLLAERATISDFVGKIASGRIFAQCYRIAGAPEIIPVVFVIGDLEDVKCPRCKAVALRGFNGRMWRMKKVRFNGTVVLGTIASLVVRYGMNVIWVRNERQMVKLALMIGQKINEGKLGKPEMNEIKKKFKSRDKRLMVLRVAYGIGEKVAASLLKKYGTVVEVFKLTGEDAKSIKEIKGIGDAFRNRIIKVNGEMSLGNPATDH